MTEFQEKAVHWGWPEWCGEIFDRNQKLKMRGHEPDFSDPRLSGLAASSFWLLVNLSSDANKPQIQIRDTIGRLTNTDGEQFDLRKFTRELFQNAFDSFSGTPEEPLFFRIELSENRLVVYHNGRPFAGPSRKCKLGEMGALSEIGVTSKDAEFDLEGQYGIGFKGWSLFYKKVMVACCDHDSEADSCKISWEVGPDSLSLELGPGTNKNVWGNEDLTTYFRDSLGSRFETPQNKPITTMYQFDVYHAGNHNIALPTISDLETELKGLTRFRSRSIIVQISVGERATTLTHIAKESPIPELADSFRYLDVTNTIEEKGQDPIEAKFVAIRIPIQPNSRLRLPVDRFIEDRRRRFSELGDENNPWKGVSPDSWFEKKSIIFGVKLNQDQEIATLASRYKPGEEKIFLYDSSGFARSGSGLIGGKQIVWSENADNVLTIESLDESYDEGTEISQDEEFSNNHWMYRMAPIDEATTAWIPGDSKLRSGSPWIIDAPFWLEQNRLRLSTVTHPTNHIEANAELLREALQSALPMLATRILDGDFSEDTELIYHSTPFDGFLSNDYSPYGNRHTSSPFQDIFWKISQSNDWKLKSYNEIFKDGIFTDLDRKIIEVEKAVRVPDSWVLGESGERLVSWLNQNIDFDEDWFDLVFTHSTGKPKLVTERTSLLAKTIPPISKDRIYQLLEDSGKLAQLQSSYPGLRGQEWFFAPIPDNVTAYISSEDRRPSGSLPDYLWQRCDEEGVMMAPPEAEATMEASEEWNIVNGIYVASIPKGSTDGEWVDRMIEILGLLEVLEEDDFRQISKRGVNTTECSWFYSKVSSFARDKVSDALVKRSISRGRGYSLCLRTSTGWFEKVGDAIAAKDGERERDEPARSNLELIDDRENILLPTDSSVNDDIDRSDHPVTLVPGSGLIPSIVMLMIQSLSQRFSVPEWTNGIFLIVNEAEGREDIEYETPFPEDLSEAWVKTPNLIFTTESEEIIPNGISHDGKIGTKPTWRTMHRNRNHHSGGVYMRGHLDSQVGHSIGIHKDIKYLVKNRVKNYEGTSVLSQDLEIRRLINDFPLDQFPLLKMVLGPYFKDQRRIHTIMKINENAASKTSNRVVFYWGRKQNTQEAWDIRQYEIIPPNSRLSNIHKALYSGGDKVFERDSFPFPRYGFRSPEKIDTIPWISGIGPEPPVQPPEGIQQISNKNIHYLIRNGSKEIGAIESLLRGITEYLDCFVEQRDDLETEDLSWLCDFLGRASRLAGIEGGGIDQLFTRFSDKISLTADTREGLLDWISEQEEITEKVQDLRTGLENLEVLNFDKLEEVISNLDPEEGWKRFTEEKLIQERSSHRFLPEPNQFESTREKKYRSKGDGKMFLVSEDDARRVFNITLEGEKEDALGWTTDHPHSRTVILNQRIEKILEAEGAKGSISGKFDFEGTHKSFSSNPEKPYFWGDEGITEVKKQELRTKSERAPEDFERRWDFFRLILSLWGFSKAPKLVREEDIVVGGVGLCPIFLGHKSEQCKIFQDGPIIRLGTNGWDLRPMESLPFVELVTSEEGIPESMLDNIITMCESTRRTSEEAIFLLMIADSSNTDHWISTASHLLGIGEGIVRAFVGKTHRDLVNPFTEDGRQQWKQEHATPPKWREDSQGSIEVKSARKLLKSYKRALKELLRRGSSGAKSDDELQKNLLRLVMTETGRDGGRDVFEDTLYKGVHSMLANEPRVSVTSDDRIRRMFIARRYPRKGTPENELIAKANLSSFPGNVLLLSSFSQNLAQNYGQEWGLKENEDKPLRGMIEKLLKRETDWGQDEYIFLRGCMKAEGKALDLKVHKYHAVMIAALDFALEEAQR